MKIVDGKVVLTDREKTALIMANNAVDCGGIDCNRCPFSYNCGCILDTIKQITDKN